MTNKNVALLGLFGIIPITVGYMYWVKQSNIKELENDIRITKKYDRYENDYKSKVDKVETRLDKEKKSYLPSTFFPIGLGEKIRDNASDEMNTIKNTIKSTFMSKANHGGSVKHHKKNNKHTKKHRKN
jgi:hypothetical protein